MRVSRATLIAASCCACFCLFTISLSIAFGVSYSLKTCPDPCKDRIWVHGNSSGACHRVTPDGHVPDGDCSQCGHECDRLFCENYPQSLHVESRRSLGPADNQAYTTPGDQYDETSILLQNTLKSETDLPPCEIKRMDAYGGVYCSRKRA